MNIWARGAVALSLLALPACEARETETSSEKLTRMISAQVGHEVELHSIETEPAETRAICGLAGSPPAALRSTVAPAPPDDVLFIYEDGKLTISNGVIIPAELERKVRRSCPSMALQNMPPVPKTSVQ